MQSTSEQHTKELAAEFASSLNGGEVVFLKGDLGTGKTTFVRGVAEALGFIDPVRSPTFTLLNMYKTDTVTIVHLDFYRFTEKNEIDGLGLEEFLNQPDTVVFIEWPEKGIEGNTILPTHTINFTIQEDDKRELNIQTHVETSA